jgi:hypothetical protein
MQEWIWVMLYAVSAKLIPDRAPEFHARLTDGSIASQRPDGAEIVAAMKRARAAPDGMVRWTETCYCPTPLQHERATVLDRYFTGIETKVIDIPEIFDGVPLMDRLAEPALPAIDSFQSPSRSPGPPPAQMKDPRP